MTDARSKPTNFTRLALTLGCCLLIVCGSAVVADDGEKPKSQLGKQTAETNKKTTAKPNSLAAFAAKAKLKARDDGDNKIKITNHNMSATAGKGTLSSGGGVTTGEVDSSAPAKQTTVPAAVRNAAIKAQNELAQQQAKVEAMEKSIADFEAEAAKRDPHFRSNPQNRAPGTRSTAELAREKAYRELFDETKKLDAMRQQAEKDKADRAKRE